MLKNYEFYSRGMKFNFKTMSIKFSQLIIKDRGKLAIKEWKEQIPY